MGFHLKLFSFVFFLLITLSFNQAKNVAVNIIGSIHCTECIKHEFSNSQASLGVDVVIRCKSKNRETKTEGNSAIDRQGRFNVTLSSEIKEDVYCFAKLQTASSSSGAPCPIQSAQTASVELLNSEQNTRNSSRASIIKFSPSTCQSAFFFCPHPNLTFFNSPLSPKHPVHYALPPLVQPPLPPAEEAVPPPSPASEPPYSPQAPPLPPPPEIETPSPLPDLNLGTPTPTPSPIQSPNYPPNPKIKTPSPSPLPIYNTPPTLPPNKPTPILPPKKHKLPKFKTPVAPPPENEKVIPPSSPIGKSKSHESFIPRAPPVPQLPPIPTVPRKYFSAPKSKPKPPRSI